MDKNKQILEALIRTVQLTNKDKNLSNKDIVKALTYVINEEKQLNEAGFTTTVVSKIFKALEQGKLKGLIKKAQRKDPMLAQQLQSLQVASEYIKTYIKNEYSGANTKEDALNMLAAMDLKTREKKLRSARKSARK